MPSRQEISSLQQMSTHEQIHCRALAVADRYRSQVAELLEILIELDANKTFEAYGCSSLYQYTVQFLKLSEDVAVSHITVARKAVVIPALRQVLKDGTVAVSKARKICSVIDDANYEHWIGLAKTLSSKELEREVAIVNPKAAVTERLTYVTGERSRLQLGVTDEFVADLKRAQDLVAGKRARAVNYEETLAMALDVFLTKHDPLRRAERIARRKASNVTATATDTDTSGVTVTDVARNVLGRMKDRIANRRKPTPAFTTHQLHLRDGARCTHHDSHGSRCENTRWLQVHHLHPVALGGDNSLENLSTRCHYHHKLEHQAIEL